MHAIVLKRREYKEYDQIISLYTKDEGKLELLTKGVKRIISKNSGNLLVGSLVDIEIAKGKEINYLTKVQSIDIFKKSRNDLLKSLAIKYIVELVDKLTKQKGEPSIFKRRNPEDSELDSSARSLEYFYNFIRMLDDPYPNAFIRFGDKKLILKNPQFQKGKLTFNGEIL